MSRPVAATGTTDGHLEGGRPMIWAQAGGGRVLLAGEGRAWTWLGVGAIAVVMLLVLYRAERKLVSRRAGLTLLALRLIAAGVLVLALFEPIAAWTRSETVRGRVIVGADVSESMSTIDPGRLDGKSRRELARGLVAGEGAALARLGDDHDVAALTFAREAGPEGPLSSLGRRMAPDPAWVAGVERSEPPARPVVVPDAPGARSARPQPPGTDRAEIGLDGSATDWSGLLSAALRTPDETPVLGVILLTDGRKNAPGDDASLVDRLAARGIPVYPVLVGSTTPPQDVAIAALKAPEGVYKGDSATIEATIKADGLPAGTKLDVSLARAGAKPINQSVTVPGEGVRPVATFRVPLETSGPAEVTVSVAPPEGDARADNDARSVVIQVADDKASVLLVDGEARWEFRYLRNALVRDPRVALEAVILQPPPTLGTAEATYPAAFPTRPTDPTMPDPIGRFDAIVVGDVDLPPDAWSRLESYVGERGGTLAIVPGPRHWPRQAGASEALRNLLPLSDLRRLEPEPGDDPAHPSLPPGAIVAPDPAALDDPAAWPMLQIGAEASASGNREAWSSLPRLPWALAGRIKPGATVLAAPARDGDDSAIIAAMPYGLGKTLWVGTDATWRWRHRVGDAIHHRFWGQVVRWAASGKLGAGNRLVRFGPTSPRGRAGEGIKIQARVAEAVPDVGPGFLIAARVVRAGSKDAAAVVPLRAVPGRPRLFEGIAPGLPEGPYAIALDVPALATVPGSEPAGPIGEATLTIAPRETSERVELAADRAPLDRLAAATGGKVFTLEDAGQIPALLKAKVRTTTRTEETPLWDHPAGLFLFLAIVGVEWTLRKRLGLP
jgi:hypothetical protein